MTTVPAVNIVQTWLLRASIMIGVVAIVGLAALAVLMIYIRILNPLDLSPVRTEIRRPTIVLYDAQDRRFASALAPGPHVADLLDKAAHGKPGARNVIDAVIAIEDRRFWNRTPLDVAVLAKAVVLEGRGGSTLPMQVIKNLFWSGDISNPLFSASSGLPQFGSAFRGFARKLQEILFSPDLESEFSKEQLLGVYLRVAPTYQDRLKGIERVSMFFYGVYPEDLSAAQAASLAAMLKAPSGYDPRNVGTRGRLPPAMRNAAGQLVYSANAPLGSTSDCGPRAARVLNNRCRSLTILAEMRQQTEGGPGAVAGRTMLDEAEYRAAVQEILTLGTCDTPAKMAQQRKIGLVTPNEELCNRTPRQYISMAIDQVEASGLTARQGSIMRIYTNFDRDHHNAVVDVLQSLRKCQFPPDSFGFSSVATSGAVKASVEFPFQGLPAVGTAERSIGISPGSTLKPFIYATWLSSAPALGLDPLVQNNDDLPTQARDGRGWVHDGRGRPWWPNRGKAGQSVLPLRRAIALSENRPLVWVGAKLGPELISRTFARAGVGFYGHAGTLAQTPQHNFPRTTQDKWSMALMGEGGAARVLPLQLVAAYSTFANAGVAAMPNLVRRVTYVDERGVTNIMNTPPSEGRRRVFAADVANAMDSALADVVTSGTASGLGLDRYGVHGKTGTVSDDRYGWFIGYPATRSFVAGAWLYSPAVQTRQAIGTGTIYLDVNSKDAARVYAAFLRRLNQDPLDAPDILPEDVCPAGSTELTARLRTLASSAR